MENHGALKGVVLGEKRRGNGDVFLLGFNATGMVFSGMAMPGVSYNDCGFADLTVSSSSWDGASLVRPSAAWFSRSRSFHEYVRV